MPNGNKVDGTPLVGSMPQIAHWKKFGNGSVNNPI